MNEMFGWRKFITITQAEDVFFGVNYNKQNDNNSKIIIMFFNSCPQFNSVTEDTYRQRGIIIDTSLTIPSDTTVFPYSQVFDKVGFLCCI